MSGLTRFERARSAVGRRLGRPWSTIEPQPSAPEPLPSFRLFGLVSPWMEGDVIAATVSNALAQGCQRVYLLDNDSPDDTVDQALAAGAVLAGKFSTPVWREDIRIEHVNRLIGDISRDSGEPHIWWLTMDADEFYCGPGGLTIRQYLDRLDRRFRTAGATSWHHVPSSTPANLVGFHPLDLQPLCTTTRWRSCPLGHWKHPLLRWDRHGATLETSIGLHQLTGPGCPAAEPRDGILLHHFPFRDEQITRRRLDALNTPDDSGRARIATPDEGVAGRWRTLAATYAGRWDDVVIESRAPLGVSPQPWQSIVPPADQPVARWYRPEELAAATAAWRQHRCPAEH